MFFIVLRCQLSALRQSWSPENYDITTFYPLRAKLAIAIFFLFEKENKFAIPAPLQVIDDSMPEMSDCGARLRHFQVCLS